MKKRILSIVLCVGVGLTLMGTPAQVSNDENGGGVKSRTTVQHVSKLPQLSKDQCREFKKVLCKTNDDAINQNSSSDIKRFKRISSAARFDWLTTTTTTISIKDLELILYRIGNGGFGSSETHGVGAGRKPTPPPTR